MWQWQRNQLVRITRSCCHFLLTTLPSCDFTQVTDISRNREIRVLGRIRNKQMLKGSKSDSLKLNNQFTLSYAPCFCLSLSPSSIKNWIQGARPLSYIPTLFLFYFEQGFPKWPRLAYPSDSFALGPGQPGRQVLWLPSWTRCSTTYFAASELAKMWFQFIANYRMNSY